MSFSSIADFQNRYDSRVIAQLSNDTNSTTINNAVIQACLDDATATIQTAALQGSQYTAQQLLDLVSGGDTMLVRMCADIALRYLSQRRASGLSSQLREQTRESNDLLESLRKGQRIFNVTNNRVADVPAMVTITASQAQNLGDLTAIDFFGGPKGTPSIYGC